MIGVAELYQGLYSMVQSYKSKSAISDNVVNATASFLHSNNIDVWHYRLGHPSTSVLSNICQKFPYVKINKKFVCDSCHQAKQSKLSFSDSTTLTAKPFELVHMDIWGPINVSSFQGFQYFLTIVDDYSRHTWIYLLKSKSDTRPAMHRLIKYIATQYDSTIKTLRSDNGQEFNMTSFYDDHGMIHQTSCVETPQQNSKVERKHRHILDVTRALLFHSNLPKKILDLCSLSCHLYNQ